MPKRTKATTVVVAFVFCLKLLERLYVLSLPALRSLGYVELHCLAFLQALEAAGLNGRKMHENVFARLAADKAVALGVIEPLYCSLFHVCNLFLCLSYAGGIGTSVLQVTGCLARTAHDRF